MGKARIQQAKSLALMTSTGSSSSTVFSEKGDSPVKWEEPAVIVRLDLNERSDGQSRSGECHSRKA